MGIHPNTFIGLVHYNVIDVPRLVSFYGDILGFELLEQNKDTASLGAGGRELLRLTSTKNRRREAKTTGLYHTAFLFPTRQQLAHTVRRLIQARAPIQGTSDHGTHLAIYLTDPEGNGIELAWDFPKDEWPVIDGTIDFFRGPRRGVDVEDLLSHLRDGPSAEAGISPDTHIGHIHLHVSHLEDAKSFYHQLLGFDVVVHSDDIGALFVSAGGYHHHIGANVWKGIGLPSPAPDAPGLRYFSVVVPERDSFDQVIRRLKSAAVDVESTDAGVFVNDPSGNRVLLTAPKDR